MKEKITQKKHPYLVVEIENNPLPMNFDVYYMEAETARPTIDLIERIVDSLTVNDKPLELAIRLVELNDEQVEYISESDGEFDIGELDSLADTKRSVNNVSVL